MNGEMKRSVCPYDCPDACGLLVEAADGKAIRVLGDHEHPHTQGTLCTKMNHYEKTVHSPERITQPLLRTGPKGTGEFAPISWDEAIDYIYKLHNNVNNLVGVVDMCENAFVYANKYRAYHEDIDHEEYGVPVGTHRHEQVQDLGREIFHNVKPA